MDISKVIGGLAIAFLLAPATAVGQTQAEQEMRRDFYKRQFADWGGIVFRCLPDNNDDELQKRLCEAAATEARLLAATGKIPFRDMGDQESLSVFLAKSEMNNALVLEAAIRATQGYSRAAHMSLRATEFYSNAVENGAKEDNPDSKPRSGDLILWERSIIGAGGTDTELGQGLSNAFSTVLKDFFGVFIESRN